MLPASAFPFDPIAAELSFEISEASETGSCTAFSCQKPARIAKWCGWLDFRFIDLFPENQGKGHAGTKCTYARPILISNSTVKANGSKNTEM